MSFETVLASRRVQSLRDLFGFAVDQAGGAIAATSPARHRRFTRALMREPCARALGPAIAAQVEGLEQGTFPLAVVTAVADVVKQALAAREFDAWIDKSKSTVASPKRTLVRCDNYPPGRRWKLQLFYIPAGHSHPPHSHDDLASCLVVARGAIAAREFNRLRSLETAVARSY